MKRSIFFCLLALGIGCISTQVAHAQPRAYDQSAYETSNYVPVPDFATETMFAPLDMSSFGSGPPANEGYFFNLDYLNWAISAPAVATVGQGSRTLNQVFDQVGRSNPAVGTYRSSLDTSGFDSEFESGSRIELGYMVKNKGVLFSAFTISQNEQVQLGAGSGSSGGRDDTTVSIFTATHGVLMVFDDPQGLIPNGNSQSFGISFNEVIARNEVKMYGAEIMQLVRLKRPPRTFAPVIDLMLGFRFTRIEEDYLVRMFAYHPDLTTSLVVDRENFIETQASNNLIGPQLGGRFFKQWGPFAFAAEGRFFGAFNYQSLKQRSEFDPMVITGLSPAGLTTPSMQFISNSITANRDEVEFSPMGELRFEGSYLVTRKIRVRGGWTGMYVAGIARPSNMVDYAIGQMGFLQNNRYDVFTHGIHLGVEINH